MNTAKAIKDLSLKSRFLPSYGSNETLYQESLEYISYWQDKLFVIDEKSFTAEVENETLKTVEIATVQDDLFPEMSTKPVNGDVLKKKLGLNGSLEVDIHGTTTTFKIGKSVDLKSIERNANTLYTGGIVTSLSWLPRTVNGKQYLAVTVINGDSGDIKSVIDSEQLSIFYTVSLAKPGTKMLKTAMQIWELDLATNNWSLYKLLDTSSLGACSNITWAPVNFDTVLGVLGGSFKDGKLHFFKIKPCKGKGPEYLEVIDLSISYGLSNPRTETEILAITSYDYLLTDRVIVGFTDGSISEFILPGYKHSSSMDSFECDYTVPSFVFNLAETPISSITVGNPIPNKYVVQVNTHGTQNFIFDYDSYKSQWLDSFGSSLRPLYHDQLKIFICLDSYDVAAYAFVRHPHERQSLFLKVDGIITSYGASKYLNHPMVLVAGSYGELFVVNVARKILSPSKTASKTLVPLRLWKLCYNLEGHKGLSFDFLIEPVPADKTNKVTVSPEQVCISCLGWNETINGSSLYAAGTHSGLLVIESLDPSK